MYIFYFIKKKIVNKVLISLFLVVCCSVNSYCSSQPVASRKRHMKNGEEVLLLSMGKIKNRHGEEKEKAIKYFSPDFHLVIINVIFECLAPGFIKLKSLANFFYKEAYDLNNSGWYFKYIYGGWRSKHFLKAKNYSWGLIQFDVHYSVCMGFLEMFLNFAQYASIFLKPGRGKGQAFISLYERITDIKGFKWGIGASIILHLFKINCNLFLTSDFYIAIPIFSLILDIITYYFVKKILTPRFLIFRITNEEGVYVIQQ